MTKAVYLGLGSNLGDRAANLQQAIERLGALGIITAVSSFYETEPVEAPGQPWFLNCVVALKTELMPRQFIAAVLEVERQMGRRRTPAKAARNIDIDVLLFGHSLIAMRELTVPHPRMHERRFVLEPLVEIAPDVRHPGLKRSVRELRDALPPGAAVRKAGVRE